MAIMDKFLGLHTEGAGGTLIVRGETVDEDGKHVDLGSDAQIFVAVIQRFAGFSTSATNLVSGDTNNTHDIFVRGALRP
jgi:hypothetical protein